MLFVLAPENDGVGFMSVSPPVLALKKEGHGSPRPTLVMVDIKVGERVGSERSFISVRSEGL